jgi:hypothetical protein
MGGRDLDTRSLGNATVDAQQALDAALHVADRVGGENPHPDDETNPRAAGKAIGQDPVIAAGVRELLAALGLPTAAVGRRALQHELRTARDFADSDAAGYIDRTGLETP